MTMTTPNDDIGFDLALTCITPRRAHAGGLSVTGTLAGHRFDALVFADHAENLMFELGTSRISKLWLRRLADGRTVFNFDRGLDVPPTDPDAERVVEFLQEGLADFAFAAADRRTRRATQVTAAGRAAAAAAEAGFATAAEAIRYAREHRPVAITVDGRYLVVTQAEADRLQAAGVEFACLAEYDGRVLTIPVNG
jgi:hypothetical protein